MYICRIQINLQAMKELIRNRIAALRSFLRENHLAAFIIPTTDPHLSEYTASHWKAREWISGFTGSAGTVVVTADEAGLWTDSRYFLQAAQELEGTGIELFKEGLPDTPSYTDRLCSTLTAGDRIGIDGKLFSIWEVENMQQKFAACEMDLVSHLDPIEKLWENRPAMPKNPAYIYDIRYAGVSCAEKIARIRETFPDKGIDGLFISALDEIAWVLNLRGEDVKCNPVVISYLLITQEEAVCFISPDKLTAEVREYLRKQKVGLQNYEDVESYLSGLKIERLQMCPVKTNHAVFSAVNPACNIVLASSPVTLLKAIRNEQELKGLHAAMIRDGVALVKFLRWLESAVPEGNETEISVDKKLHEFRAEQDLYKGESFDTIAGYKEHGAIVHYSATPESDVKLKPESFLLLDSGAQYLDGTTDITRTIALGQLTEEEKTDYTLILKGHIALASCKFPQGTRGAQLDILARLGLWKAGMNYLHGTGHGVGHFLSVHEGPQSIRMNENPVVLLPGMLTSNEPGIYKGGKHGVRTENLVLVCEDMKTESGQFYRFETVTLCPIDTKGIIRSMLTQEEADWLNEYHQTVYNKLSPYLNKEENSWLKEKTTAI